MHSWGAFDKHTPEIDLEIELLKLELKQQKNLDFTNKTTIQKQDTIIQKQEIIENNLDNVEDILRELNNLTGLKQLKSEINNLIDFLKIQKKRQEFGMSQVPITLHLVFCGSPGTGKTTVARLIGKIYKELGILKKGHCIETDRSGMVAEYIGHTAQKVDKLIESALDGVLFIDEAYALKPENSDKDFGQEAIDTLLKRMEDYRERLVVIVAGYNHEMSRFIESNPGLQSRFTRYFTFEDYRPNELVAIFQEICNVHHYQVNKTVEKALLTKFTKLFEQRDKNFGNARLVRNLFEKTIERQATRLTKVSELNQDNIVTIMAEDIA